MRSRQRRKLGFANLHPPGPQDFSELLEEYKNGKNSYANKHGVQLDWYLPASEPDFTSAQANYFDWSTTRVLRFRPDRGSAAVKRTIFYFNGGAFVSSATSAHSYICTLLAHRLNACVYLFPCELAPTGIAASQLPKMTDFYLRVAQRARNDGHEIIIAGDR